MLHDKGLVHRLRVYLDTSVIGGVFDAEFAEDSARLLEAVHRGSATALVSAVTLEELASAPPRVQEVLLDLPAENLIRLPGHADVEALTEAYLAAGTVTERLRADAAHVAAATHYSADVLASWNFQHIVNLRRIQLFNAVNLAHGYRPLEIRSPRELFRDEPDGNI
jgi:predicted nucleic acid-binding protein